MPPVVDEFARRAMLEEIGRFTLPIAVTGPIVEVRFPVAATRRDITHGLDTTPDGYFILLQSGGVVTATDVTLWTTTVAWMTASADNTWARLCFYTLRTDAVRVVVS